MLGIYICHHRDEGIEGGNYQEISLATMASTSSQPVVLLLGGGPNIGEAVVKHFSLQKFRIAVVSRKRTDGIGSNGVLNISADLSDPPVIPTIFAKVEKQWEAPSIVIYNAAARTVLPPDDPLSALSLSQYQHDHNVNVTSAILACQHAVEGFARLPPSPHKTFIHTGNKLKAMPLPPVLMFGMHKAAMAHAIWDCTVAYKDEGYKFYFTDERFADGRAAREEMSGGGERGGHVGARQGSDAESMVPYFCKGEGVCRFWGGG